MKACPNRCGFKAKTGTSLGGHLSGCNRRKAKAPPHRKVVSMNGYTKYLVLANKLEEKADRIRAAVRTLEKALS